ncbi:MAG: FtsW/RodA/SpoVE family cell cycle protein [Jiangellales bacterium]
MSAPVDAAVAKPARRISTGRWTEFVLVLVASAIAVGAFASVGLGTQGEAPTRILAYGVGFVVVGMAAHLFVRWRAPYADPVLLPTALALNGIGLAMIHRLDVANETQALLNDVPVPAPEAPGQLIWSLVGLLLLAAVLWLVRDHRMLARYTYLTFLLGVGLLLLPLMPGIGVEINGARIWVSVFGQSFQPGEAAKVVMVVAFSSYLVAHREALALAGRRVLGIDLPRGRDLGPILLVWALAMAILVLQRDLGAAVLFFGVFVVLLFVATERVGWLVVGGLLAVVGGYTSYLLFDHVQRRVNGWLSPFADTDANLQIIQSLYGLAYGGLIGTGLGRGQPDLIPFAESDFIAAALGEELGLAGLMVIILLYGVLVARGLRIAIGVRDAFGTLLATGLATTVGLQVFVVIGGVTKLIPLTGLTTPFLSLGGSSLVMNWVIVALLMRVSDAARRPAPPPPPPLAEANTQAVRIR